MLGEYGADIEAKSDNGCTPLRIAAQHGRHEAARLLVEELGADVAARTSDGHTPLELVNERYRSSHIGIL